MNDKREIRNHIRTLKQQLTEAEISSWSSDITRQLMELDEYRQSAVILAYMSANQEVRCKPVIEAAWEQGKTVAVPRVLSARKMEFFSIDAFDNMTEGYGGILEPLPDMERIVSPDNALMIMPGLAFDRTGNRIGYGGGYYDIYLDMHRESRIFKVALCFDFQLMDSVPEEEQDIRADMIITPTELIRITK